MMTRDEMAKLITERFANIDKKLKGQGEMVGLLLQQFLLLSAMVEPLVDEKAKEVATKKAGKNIGKMKAMAMVDKIETPASLFAKYGAFKT
jgi:hypothetical protein